VGVVNGKQITQVNYLQDCLGDDFRDCCLFDGSLYCFDASTAVSRLEVVKRKE
jgi:hypothetical protein